MEKVKEGVEKNPGFSPLGPHAAIQTKKCTTAKYDWTETFPKICGHRFFRNFRNFL
jgi:hypothetical protein